MVLLFSVADFIVFYMVIGIQYYSARAYQAKNMDELSLDIRVVVEVLQKSDSGWWLIR